MVSGPPSSLERFWCVGDYRAGMVFHSSQFGRGASLRRTNQSARLASQLAASAQGRITPLAVARRETQRFADSRDVDRRTTHQIIEAARPITFPQLAPGPELMLARSREGNSAGWATA